MSVRRAHPVVIGASVILVLGANKRQVFDARNITRIRQVQVTVGVLILVQLGERAVRCHQLNQLLVFIVRAGAPLNLVGASTCRDLVHPLLEAR